jgi:hypothetical protein
MPMTASGHHGAEIQPPRKTVALYKSYNKLHERAATPGVKAYAGRNVAKHGRAKDGKKVHNLVRREWQRLLDELRPARRDEHRELARLAQGNLGAWECIARHESGNRWDINTGNGYYGGLQMDLDFQAAYGNGLLQTKGTANNWTKWEQIAAANRAHAVRGFSPWPNTARMCGLL